MIQQYGRGVGQGLLGATAPAVANNPTPTVGVANSGISSGALDVSGATKGSQLGYGSRVASKRKQRGELPMADEETLAGIGGSTKPEHEELTGGGGTPYKGGPVHYTTGSIGGTPAAKTPALQSALNNSPVMQQARGQISPMAINNRGPAVGGSVTTPAQAPLAGAGATPRSGVPMSAGVPIYEKDRNEYNLHPGGPGYAGSLAERINLQNPTGRADLPYAQGGTNGGWIDGIGETISMGRSITPLLAKQQELQALRLGIPQNFIQGFKQANPGDTNRLIEAYNSEQGGQGVGGPSWQNYALPSESEVNEYFGGSGGSGGGSPQQPAAPAGPSREEIEAEVRAKIEAENKAKADADKKKADEDAEYRRTHPRGALPGEKKKK